ncbi:hypothetical protein, partial [Rhodopirellula baltica]|uniref:hypothetical protein n=1 Tax=Rhodopirellula baltica TaxID=265606 RepID=UPI001F2BDD57
VSDGMALEQTSGGSEHWLAELSVDGTMQKKWGIQLGAFSMAAVIRRTTSFCQPAFFGGWHQTEEVRGRIRTERVR